MRRWPVDTRELLSLNWSGTAKERDLRQFDGGCPSSEEPDKLRQFGVLHRAIDGIPFPNVDIGEIVLAVRPDDT